MENYTKYRLKTEPELISALSGFGRLFVLSCNKCFKEFDDIIEPECDAFVAFAQAQGKTVTGTARLDFLCNKTQTAKALAIPAGTDAVAVISCGLGIQTVAELTDLPVVAACDSISYTGYHGMALTEKACGACAQCYLNLTGGICPVVDCSKSLLNGQCGGAKNGKCEISPDKDCAWQKIQERLASQGRLEELKCQSVQIRDYSKINFKVINDYVKAIRAERLEGYYGGVHPTERTGITEHLSLVRFPEQDTVAINLAQHAGAPAECVVSLGDTVKVGQILGRAAAPISANIHSSVSGRVIAIGERPHATRGGMALSVVIENDRRNTLHESVRPRGTLEELTGSEIAEIVEEAGIVGMGGAGFPTHVKLRPGKPIDTVLLNGCECEPLLTADHRVLLEYADEIIFGLKAIMKAVAAPRGILVIEDNKPDAISLFEEKIAREETIELVTARTKYPQGAEKMLIKRVLGRQVPSGGLPADVGVAVFNVSTAKAISDAIQQGMPLTERVVTVTGARVKNPGNFLVKIGTGIRSLLEYCGVTETENCEIKVGGPMMGTVQQDLNVAVTKCTNGVVVIDAVELEPQACIKCGRCVDVCPMELKPLHFAKQVMDPAALKKLNILDCMECGCCQYICASKIPLVTLIKTGKTAVRGMK